ncbi:MAG TPA: AAA-like domain-containing protein, partial [Chthonomonadaceae bacterium]|nr:AAA-like domain-containing protein [Chthonomonadaceae bacterium]
MPEASPELEIAHVLFIDIVGYSRHTLPDQLRLQDELQQALRASYEFQKTEGAAEQLIRLPTGDGAALVFFRNPLSPVRCALEVAGAAAVSGLKLRMGVHTGYVYRVRDINGNWNVSGEGINMAQRIMDCGDAGHILLSASVVAMLAQLGGWSEFIRDLDFCEIKHGERVRVYNLVRDGLGNKATPEKMVSLRVALLYKRNAHPDEEILKLLEAQLLAHGCHVFIDRHLQVGVEWAKEIERQIRSADAVIPLLSVNSIHSEMLAYEVSEAYKGFQGQGKPRLLPVRVAYTGPLSEEIAGILDPVQQTLWETPEDDARLVSDILYAIQNPTAPTQPLALDKLEPVGGAVALDSKFWIVRPTEAEFRAAIARHDSIVLLKGARQMGKTSLLARGLQQGREAGAKCIQTDFQKLNNADLESVDTLFLALAERIADQLDLDVLPQEVWNPKRGANVNFERFLRREVLNKLDAPVIWAMDEVDRLFTCDFGSEVFGLFRSWHNERSLDPTGPWSRLTLAIAYATEAHLFITDMNQSPFNVGTRLTLEDFTLEQVTDLNRRYGGPLRDAGEIARYYKLVSGQPYLTRRGLNAMVSQQLDIAMLEGEADREEGL